jgi:rubrerythrin
MGTDTGTKPSYLGLLNAIAVAEAEAECYLAAWAEVTPYDDVRQVLRTVALREGEHGKAFAKRICELGYDVMPKSDEGVERRMQIAASTTLSDCDKFEQLKVGQEPVDGNDVFAGMFKDPNIDIQTGALLGRYIAEERDSGRMLRACRETVTARASNGSAANGHRDEELAQLNSRLDRIEKLLEKSAKK